MKKYDRETRKYVPEEELNKKQSKRKLCKGGKPHDFLLVIPDYKAEANDGSVYGFDVAEEYYKIAEEYEKERDFLHKKYKEKMMNAGITIPDSPFLCRLMRINREYVCGNCGKRKYDYK